MQITCNSIITFMLYHVNNIETIVKISKLYITKFIVNELNLLVTIYEWYLFEIYSKNLFIYSLKFIRKRKIE